MLLYLYIYICITIESFPSSFYNGCSVSKHSEWDDLALCVGYIEWFPNYNSLLEILSLESLLKLRQISAPAWSKPHPLLEFKTWRRSLSREHFFFFFWLVNFTFDFIFVALFLTLWFPFFLLSSSLFVTSLCSASLPARWQDFSLFCQVSTVCRFRALTQFFEVFPSFLNTLPPSIHLI